MYVCMYVCKIMTSTRDSTRTQTPAKKFQRTLPICSAPIRGGKALQGFITVHGNSGVAGVANRRLINFAPL